MNFLIIFRERIINVFIWIIDNFDDIFSYSLNFIIFNNNIILFFEMILNDFKSKFWVWIKFKKNFNENKFFIDIIIFRILNIIIKINLNWFLNLLFIYIEKYKDIKILDTLFIFTFEDIIIKIFIYNKFIIIKESNIYIYIFQSWKILELQVDCKLRGFLLQMILYWYIINFKIMRNRL